MREIGYRMGYSSYSLQSTLEKFEWFLLKHIGTLPKMTILDSFILLNLVDYWIKELSEFLDFFDCYTNLRCGF